MIKSPLVLLAAAAMAAPAFADSQSFAFQFRFDRADLATAQGAARVHDQLLTEATMSCRRKAPSAQRTVDTACRELLVGSVLKQINSPMLTAASEGGAQRSGR